MTARRALAEASRMFSSSRLVNSAGSGAGAGVLGISSSPETVTPGMKLDGVGMLIGRGVSIGKKLLRFATLDVGEAEVGGARRLLDMGEGALTFNASVDGLRDIPGCSGSTEEPDRLPNVPVVENRISIRGEEAFCEDEWKSGLNKGIGPSDIDLLIGVERPEDVEESTLIFPIDIFFRKPHLPFSFPSLERPILYLSTRL